jgi:hypothetical protein
LLMDILNDLRLSKYQKFVVSFQVVSMTCETGPPKIGLTQFMCLDHGAHRTIQNQDALPDELFDRMGHVGYESLAKKRARILSRAADSHLLKSISPKAIRLDQAM